VTAQGLRQRLAAILAADCAGYSRLMAADDRATVAALDAARETFRSHIEAHGGRVIDMAGDSVLALFETASGALDAALAVQETLKVSAGVLPEAKRMRFRIGVHLGDVMEKGDGSVYGDGVNIAARLQAMAEPGGITISEAVHGAVKTAVAAGFCDQGEQQIKNIPRPVRAFSLGRGAARKPARRRLAAALAAGALALVVAVALVWLTPWRPTPQAALSLPSKPSIAILPFENIGGDPEQAYFADGMTDDLITDLSKIEGLFVIARNSTFAYKGKARDPRGIANALGVRYVLEGSVRRSGGEVRINAQVIDASTGGHVWADRYDGDMRNIFALQDKVARSVVAALAVQLTSDDRGRVARRGTDNVQAYDAFLKGWQHYLKQTPEDFRAAIIQFGRAIELDPKYGRAYAALSATYWEASRRFWDVAMGLQRHHEAQFQAEQYLVKAMLDPTPLAHQIASGMLLHMRQHEKAIAEAQKAIARDPNDADGYVALAGALNFSGKPVQAMEMIERGMRLNPHFPPHYLYQYGLAQFGMNRPEAAATTLERALSLSPDDHWSQRLLLATYGLLQRRDRAAELLEEARRGRDRRGWTVYLDPLTVKAITYWHPFASQADAERFAEGLRQAGVPD
jgi:adenylate cyclase